MHDCALRDRELGLQRKKSEESATNQQWYLDSFQGMNCASLCVAR